MIKTTATALKNQLGKFMRAVQSGKEVVITDRDRPVAKLVPFSAGHRVGLSIREADPTAPSFGMATIVPLRVNGVDSLALLTADRNSR